MVSIWTYGRLHRTDGPAIIFASGAQHWYLNGRCHRTDGPAVIYADGTQEWWVNNKLHRANGPAVIYANGSCRWFLNNTEITNDVNKWMTELDITYPFDNEHQALFLLTFGGK